MAQSPNQPSTGSSGGTTFSRNRYGLYSRNRTTPINPQTVKQQQQRQLFSTYTLLWKTLTSGKQLGWETFALTHPVTNRLGQQVILAPNAMYVRTQLVRVSAGLTPDDDPPSTLTFNSNTLSLVATIDTTGPTRVLTLSGTNQPTGYKAIVKASAPVSQGRITPNRMTFVRAMASEAWETPIDFNSQFTGQWGSFQIGQRIIVDVQLVTDTGYATGFERAIANVVDITP